MVSDPKKAEVVDRLVDFLTSPDPSASKGPVAKKPKAAAKKVRRGPFFFCSRGCVVAVVVSTLTTIPVLSLFSTSLCLNISVLTHHSNAANFRVVPVFCGVVEDR